MNYKITKSKMSESKTNSECQICCETFNNSTKAKVSCGHCNLDACKKCVRMYLLTTTSGAHCMGCKNAWDRDFTQKSLNKSFFNGSFKDRRKELLFEGEKARFPETMPAVENYKNIQVWQKEEKESQIAIDQLREKVYEMEREKRKLHNNIRRAQSGEIIDKNNQSKFIRKCPSDACEGFLSSAWKCGVCDIWACSKCFEEKGYNKDAEHTCNANDLASAELIKKETKGCPKCGVRIFKISGCDQMWCTECKVAFSWNTGKIVLSGTIHNPHYYNYLQGNGDGNGNVPRNPGDIVCGGIIPYHNLNNMLRYISQFSQPSWFQYFINTSSLIKQYFEENKILNINHYVVQITELHRHINHISNVDLVNSRNKVRTLGNHDNNTVQYILNKKTKKELADIIFKNDIQRKKSNELLNVYELLSVVGIERFANINDYYINNLCSKDNSKDKQNSINKLVKLITMFIEFANEYNNLIQYVNKQLYNISYTYNLTVAIYKLTTSGSWDTVSIKCKQSDILKIK